jgi:hypothetical protein
MRFWTSNFGIGEGCRPSLSKVNRTADLLQAFFNWRLSLERVPPLSHRDSDVELAAASVFHAGSMRFKSWRMSVWRAHDDDKVNRLTVPSGEEVVGPVHKRIIMWLSKAFLHAGDHRGSLCIHRLSHVIRHCRFAWRLRFCELPSTFTHTCLSFTDLVKSLPQSLPLIRRARSG